MLNNLPELLCLSQCISCSVHTLHDVYARLESGFRVPAATLLPVSTKS